MHDAVHEHARRNEGMSAQTITVIYVLSGGLWILFSDAVLHELVADAALLLKLQTFKGWFYVAATGLMLFMLIGRSTGTVRGINEALRRNQTELQTVLNTIPALVFVTDAEDRLLRFNSLFARAAGAPSEQLVGKNCTELFLFADLETHCRNDEEIIRTGKPKLNMVERIETDEGSKWFEVSKMPLMDEGGAVQGLLGFAVDITERRLAEEALRESQSLLQSILDNAPISIFVKDLEGHYQLVNRSFQQRCNVQGEEIQGRTDYDFAPPEQADAYRCHDRAVIESNTSIEREDVVNVGGAMHTYIAIKFPLVDTAGAPYAICGISTDITERKLMEERLRAERLLSDRIIDSLPGTFYIFDQAGRFVRWNRNLETLTGYSDEEIVKMSPLDFMAGDDKEVLAQKVEETLTVGEATMEAELVARDGRRTPFFFSGTRLEIDGQPCVAGMGFDISKRRQAEEQLRASREQLRALSARLLSAREEERKSIAREIHDELGQALTGLIIELSWLEDKLALLPDGEAARPLRTKIASMLRLADSTVESVRSIAAKLRPGLLDDFGLVAAIEWHAQEFEKRAGVSCQVSSELDETILSPEQATALFRITQEALTNVARHAAATAVQVRIIQDGNQLLLSVEDNGRGIGEEELSSAHSLGVIGMRERATLLGGDLQVTGSRGGGTRVVARVPIGSGNGEAEAA